MGCSRHREAIFPEAAALRAFSTFCSASLGSVQSAQTPDCSAARELASYTDPELVDTAFCQGALLSVSARDQAEALARSFSEPVLTIAPWPIARNLVEASAIGAWLLDPKIGAQVRVSRSFAFRYKGLVQQLKVARAAKSNTLRCQDAIDRLEESAHNLGYPIIRNAKGKLDGVAERMPAITDLVGSVLDAEIEYRILCAVVHGHGWALRQLGLVDQGPGQGQVIGSSSRLFRKGVSKAAVKFACFSSGDALNRLHENRAKLFGVDPSPLQDALRTFQAAFVNS